MNIPFKAHFYWGCSVFVVKKPLSKPLSMCCCCFRMVYRPALSACPLPCVRPWQQWLLPALNAIAEALQRAAPSHSPVTNVQLSWLKRQPPCPRRSTKKRREKVSWCNRKLQVMALRTTFRCPLRLWRSQVCPTQCPVIEECSRMDKSGEQQ